MEKTLLAHLTDIEKDIQTVLSSVIDDNVDHGQDVDDPAKIDKLASYIEGLKVAQNIIFLAFEDIKVKVAMEQALEDPYTQDVLRAIGSDYDENGIPYWEKWHAKEEE